MFGLLGMILSGMARRYYFADVLHLDGAISKAPQGNGRGAMGSESPLHIIKKHVT